MLCWCLKKICSVLYFEMHFDHFASTCISSHEFHFHLLFFYAFIVHVKPAWWIIIYFKTPLTLLFMCPPLQSITVFKLLLDFHSFPLTWVASCLNAQRIAAHFLHDHLQIKESAHIYTCCVNAVCDISWLKYHWHRIDLDIRALCNIISSPVTMVISTNIVGMLEDSHRSYLCLNDWITSTD